jgi:poly(3-hydroxybutyrate) depolymerase
MRSRGLRLVAGLIGAGAVVAASLVAAGGAGAQSGVDIALGPLPAPSTTAALGTAGHSNSGEPTGKAISGWMDEVPAGWTAAVHRITVGGVQREYLELVPATLGTARLPVLVVLHGRGMTPVEVMQSSSFPAVVGRGVLVYPLGYGLSWNAGTCCGTAQVIGMNDVAFLNDLVPQVLSNQPLANPTEVFLAGFSNGGRMTYRVACSPGTPYRGFAAVEAAPVFSCPGAQVTIPFIDVAFTADPYVNVDPPSDPSASAAAGRLLAGAPGRAITALSKATLRASLPASGGPASTPDATPTSPSSTLPGGVTSIQPVLTTIGAWQALEGCDPNFSTAESSNALSLTEWTLCAGGGRVELAMYQGGGHWWPQGGAGVPSAQQLIWSFFLGQPPAPLATTGVVSAASGSTHSR